MFSGGRPGRRFLTRVVLLLCLAVGLVAVPAASTAGDTTLTFEDATPGTTIDTQYGAQGVTFAPDPTVYGIPNAGDSSTCADPVAKSVSASSGHSGTVAIIGGDCPYGEFPSPGNVFMVFSQLRSSLSVKVLDTGTGSFNHYTLTGYDTGGNSVATDSVPGATAATVLSLHVSTATPQIAYAIVTEPKFVTDKFDDLSFDNPAVEPDVGLGFQTTADLTQGQSLDFPLTLQRFNGSNGNVALSVSGLPAGVSSSISPSTLTGTNTKATLTLTASQNATVGKATVTLTATPGSLAAGSGQRSIQRTVQVEAPFSITVPSGYEAPCTVYSYPIKINPATTFNQPVNLTVGPGLNAPPGLAVSISPGTVSSQNAWGATMTVTTPSTMQVPLDPQKAGQSFWINVSGSSSGVPSQSTVMTEFPYAGKVTSAGQPYGADQLNTPSFAQWAKASDAFTVGGEGFCPGSKVEVGNAIAQGPATAIPGGHILQGTVPELATTGNVRVLTPNGATLTYPNQVHVSTFRNNFGFQFKNGTALKPGFPYVTRDDLDALYGKDETNLDFYGLLIRKPEAKLLESVTDKTLEGGFCYGIALESAALMSGRDVSYIYPPFKNVRAFGLDGPDRPSGQLGAHLAAVFSIQFSDEVIPQVVNQVLGQWISPADDDSDVRDIQQQLAQGTPPLVSMIPGLSGGHVVVPYRTEALSGGATEIDVYDSNVPYISDEESADGATHQDRMSKSRIIVKKDGTWTFNDGILNWNGDDSNLLVLHQSKTPVLDGKSPHVPNYFTILGVRIFMGSTGDKVVQATDASGKTRFDSNGNLKPDSQSPKIPVWSPFTDLGNGSDRWVASQGGQLGIDIKRGGHPSDVLLEGHRLAGNLHTGARSGLDHVGWHPGAGSLSLKSGSASPVTASLIATVGGPSRHDEHVAQVTLGASKHGSDSFHFVHGATLELDHKGSPTTVKVTLQSVGRNQMPDAVQLPPLHLGKGQRLVLSPSWRALSGKAIKAKIGGKVRTLRARELGHAFAHVKSAALKRQSGKVTLRLRVKVGRVPANGQISLAVRVKGRRLAPAIVSAPALHKGTITVVLNAPKLRAGRYRVNVTTASEGSAGQLVEPVALTHFSARVRLR